MPENEHGNSIVPHNSADIPKKDRGEIVHQYERTMVYGGPIPPASMLREYNEVLPGAAERIFKMAELQSEHRIFLEKTVIVGDSKRADKGLWIGAAIAFVVLGGSITCIVYPLVLSQWPIYRNSVCIFFRSRRDRDHSSLFLATVISVRFYQLKWCQLKWVDPCCVVLLPLLPLPDIYLFEF